MNILTSSKFAKYIQKLLYHILFLKKSRKKCLSQLTQNYLQY